MMNPTQLPVILVASGLSHSTQIAIDQASACGIPVTMISDARYENCRLEDICQFEQLAAKFDKLYIHRSSNPAWFEQAAWRRWFILADYMAKRSVPAAFSCDGDFFLFKDPSLTPYARNHRGFSACRPLDQQEYDWVVSGHACYWSQAAILEFCSFCFGLMEDGDKGLLHEKWLHHQRHNTPGGICDMTALYLYWEHTAARAIPPDNLLEPAEGMVFDLNFGFGANLHSREFALHRGRKAISRWHNQMPVCQNLLNGQGMEFIGFHFQGHLKNRMKRMRTVCKLGLKPISEYIL